MWKGKHEHARGPHPQYPARFDVSSAYVDWDVPYDAYKPVDFTAKAVLDNDRSKNPKGWADPAEWTPELAAEVAARRSDAVVFNGTVNMGLDGKPRNPSGRTGMVGRGLLGKWGPNYAADPIVTRFEPKTNKLQMVAIQRGDTGAWAIPGGMVDAGEEVSVTLWREFAEETQNISEADAKAGNAVREKLVELFKHGGTEVYRGYVDDPRNTDNAWMETTVVHFHITDPDLARNLTLAAGDDAVHVRWLDVDDDVEDFRKLYASHRDLILKAVEDKLKDDNAPDYSLWIRAAQKLKMATSSVIAELKMHGFTQCTSFDEDVYPDSDPENASCNCYACKGKPGVHVPKQPDDESDDMYGNIACPCDACRDPMYDRIRARMPRMPRYPRMPRDSMPLGFGRPKLTRAGGMRGRSLVTNPDAAACNCTDNFSCMPCALEAEFHRKYPLPRVPY